MNEAVREKLAKIYELVNRGATEGERAAAKIALDKIIKKYNITESQLADIELRKYVFKYSTNLEYWLIGKLLKLFAPHLLDRAYIGGYNAKGNAVKQVTIKAIYQDWITIESSYEYFRRHMKKEWIRICEPSLKKCRKAKTKTARRNQLQEIFFSQYCIASELYLPGDLSEAKPANEREYHDYLMINNVEGGKYNKQVAGGLYLGNG